MEWDAKFAKARRVVNVEPITDPTEGEIRRMVRAWFHDLNRANAQNFLAEKDEVAGDREKLGEILCTIDEDEAHLTGIQDPWIMQDIRKDADTLLEVNNIRLPNDHQLYLLTSDLVQRGLLEAVKQRRQRWLGQHERANFDPVFEGVSADSPPPQGSTP